MIPERSGTTGGSGTAGQGQPASFLATRAAPSAPTGIPKDGEHRTISVLPTIGGEFLPAAYTNVWTNDIDTDVPKAAIESCKTRGAYVLAVHGFDDGPDTLVSCQAELYQGGNKPILTEHYDLGMVKEILGDEYENRVDSVRRDHEWLEAKDAEAKARRDAADAEAKARREAAN